MREWLLDLWENSSAFERVARMLLLAIAGALAAQDNPPAWLVAFLSGLGGFIAAGQKNPPQ
jgi:membrane protein DedA with SNARE-associated domain